MILIKNGNIVNSEKVYKSDLLIKDGKIVKIQSEIEESNCTVIDAKGKYILPGAIDSHTHFDLDVGSTVTADDFFSGTRAAICGGTTTILDFATQTKGDTLENGLKLWKEKAKNKAFCDYGFHMAITHWNENTKGEMKNMVKEGITSFKMYMAYKNSLQVDDGEIYSALQESVEIKALIGFHCENGDLIYTRNIENIKNGKTTPYYHHLSRPEVVETEAINRVLAIAQLAKSPIWVVHLSTANGLKEINFAKQKGQKVIVETCPQYLLLDESSYGNDNDNNFEAAKYVMSPPLRKKENQKHLWEGLKNNEIDFISTDHCSFNFKEQKELGKDDYSKIPNGAGSVEHRLLLMYTYGVLENKITINEMVKLLSENPAKVFGMKDKGAIQVGLDADIVILNPEKSGVIKATTQKQNVDYTPYENFDVKGQIEMVLLRGEVVVKNNEIIKEKSCGKFIKRNCFDVH